MPVDSPYARRAASHTIGKAGRASETRLAKSLGGQERPASGALQGAKGDINLGEILMEAKSTTGKSIGLSRDWLLKIANEARSEQKQPALMLSFINPNGRPLLDGEWVCIPRHVWENSVK